jgi:hypothetical protein
LELFDSDLQRRARIPDLLFIFPFGSGYEGRRSLEERRKEHEELRRFF